MKSPKEGITMDFTVSVGQCRVVEQHRGKIVEIFGVDVNLPPLNQHSSAGVGGSNSAPVWIELSGEKGNAEKARRYILSMCCTNEVHEQYPPELLDNLDLDEIMRETQAFIVRDERDKVLIRGDDQMAIVQAKSLIEHKYDSYKQQKGNKKSGHNLRTQKVGDVVSDLIIVPPRVSVPPEERTVTSGDQIVYGDSQTVINVNITTPLNPPRCPDDQDTDVKRSSSSSSHGDSDTCRGLVSRDPSTKKGSVEDLPVLGADSVSKYSVIQPPKGVWEQNFSQSQNNIHSFEEIDSSQTKDSKESVNNVTQEIEPEIKRQLSVDRTRIREFESPQTTLNDDVTLGIMQKLGFSRIEVEQIMQKLGPNASENEILGCLVSQNKSGPPSDLIREGHTPAVDIQERQVRDISDSSGPAPSKDDADNLRTIIIDGSNVAMSYGNKNVFACKGIAIAVDWFLTRGHREIFVFVPNWRKEAAKPDTPITDQHILDDLNKLQILVFTPSRRIGGRRVVCYDDRYIIKTAVTYDGIVVSNDNFRDLQNEQPEFKKVIEERLLMFSFVGNQFMPPDDPLGRHGPSLDNFLRKRPIAPDHPPQQCPYGKKCTYGNKCKYFHPGRSSNQKSISEELKERDEHRKQDQRLNAILDYKRDEQPIAHRLNMHHGYQTDPLPVQRRREQIDLPLASDSDPAMASYRPRQASVGHSDLVDKSALARASYSSQGSPHRVSTYQGVHPPPHVHSDAKRGGYYTTEPIPPSLNTHVEPNYGTVPLSHLSRQMGTHSTRHSSLPGGAAGGGGGPYSELHAKMDALAIGGSAPIPDTSTPYNPNPGMPVSYQVPPPMATSHSTHLPPPDHRRLNRPPHPHQQIHRPYPMAPHTTHLTGGHHQYPPSGYPHHSGSQSSSSSLPPRMPTQGLYPGLPNSRPINSYPDSQRGTSGYAENIHPALPRSAAFDQRHYFMVNYKDVYGEKAILDLFDKYPNETNHGRLHELIQHLRM